MLAIVIITLFCTLFARLWYLQIMATQEFKSEAAANYTRVVLEQAPRGRIFDRNGVVLVDNRISVVVTVDRNKLAAIKTDDERNNLLDRLGAEITRYTFTPVDRAFLLKRLADVRYSPYTPVPVVDDAPKPLQVYLAEHHDDFGDVVDVTQTTVRDYPLGRTASHVLGYVGSVTQEELDARKNSPKEYSPGDEIGKTGVERTYEDDLRGTPGKRVFEVDAKGRTVRELSYTPPVPGNDVYLTIDANVQALTEHALAEELDNARNRRNSDGSYNASPAGASVILDPNTGEVIAMASFPDFDPADFTHPIPTDTWNKLNDPANFYPLNNRALQGQYAPGSTFKLVTAMAALRTGLITPATTIDDTGVYNVPGCTGGCSFYNSGGGAALGPVNLQRAITVSSDVYFYRLGGEFWINKDQYQDPIQATARDFGFAAETGIPLPGEQSGFVLTPAEKKANHDANPQAWPYGDWYTGDSVQLAIGQNAVAVTPLQLANAYGTFANGGTLYAPNIALKITAPASQNVIRSFEPRALHHTDIPAEFRDPMLKGFEGVTSDPHGTAHKAFQGWNGWPVAGKTGTAQVQGKTDTSLFVGFGPADGPQYVGTAVLEESGFGADAAAPVIRRVFQALADPATAPTVGPGGVLSSPLPTIADTTNSGAHD
jgi:penicillin-binding protein 2